MNFPPAQPWAVYAAAALALAAALFCGLARRRAATRARHLGKSLRHLASGHYNTRIPQATRRPGPGDALGALASDFNVLAESLERSRDARQQWIADISHELRTPLTILRGEIQAIEDGVRPLDGAALQSLSAEVRRLGQLVEDLYQLALADVGALACRKQPVDLAGIVREALDLYAARFEGQRLRLEASLPDGQAVAQADAQRLRQLFCNLLENSLRYTHPGGQVSVGMRLSGGEAVLDFQDSAPGVPAESLPRLFDRLYRVERSRSRGSGGAGLGLAICQTIAEAHGGGLSAQPSPLGGLWLRLRLPLTS